jgi:hypothetical protein
LSSSIPATAATPLAVLAPVVGPRVEWLLVRPEGGAARLAKVSPPTARRITRLATEGRPR